MLTAQKKAFEKLGWLPKTSLEELINEMIISDLEIAKKVVKFLLPSLTLTIIILFFAFSPILTRELQNDLRNLLSLKINN